MKRIGQLLKELLEAGVYSVENEIIISRRMVRDTAKAETDRQNGRSGGNPKLKVGVNPPDKAQKLDARNQNIEKKKDGAEAPTDLFVASPVTDEKRYFDRFKEIVGPRSGGLAAKLLRAKSKVVGEAMSILELSRTKSDPAAYIGAVIRGADRSETGAQQQPGYGDSWW